MATLTTAQKSQLAGISSTLGQISSGLSSLSPSQKKAFESSSSSSQLGSALGSLSSKVSSIGGSTPTVSASNINTPAINLPPKPVPANLMGTASGAMASVAPGLASLGYTIDPTTGQYTYTQPKTAEEQLPTSDQLILKAYRDIQADQPNKEKLYTDLYNQAGIKQKEQAVQSYTNQINAITSEANANALAVTGQGRGIPEVIIGGQQAQIQKEAAIRTLPLTAQLAAAQGDLQTAQKHLDTLYGIRVADAQQEYDYAVKYIDAVKEMANKRDAIKLDEQKTKRAEDFQLKRDDAAFERQKYMSELGFQQNLTLKGLNADGTPIGGTIDSGDLVAYASNYADTGKLPTPAELKLSGLSVGEVTSYAKQMPKPSGALVSTNTGIKSSKLSSTEQDAIIAMNEIVNKTLPSLKDRFGKINTGIVGGTAGKIWTSQDRQDYNTFRAEFLSKLLVARSGAAVTEPEYNRYAALLPGTFNQPLFLGSDGMKKLNSLESSMKTNLDNILNSKQQSIYGYSKVDVGGIKRTVGEVIDIGGQQYKVLPDGTLTDII